MKKNWISAIIILFLVLSFVPLTQEPVNAACKHKSLKKIGDIAQGRKVKSKALDYYVYGGFQVPSKDTWSSYQGVAGGCSANYMTGKGMSINAKITVSPSILDLSFLKGTFGYSETTFKFIGVVGPKNKASYGKDRYVKYFVVKQYRKYALYRDITVQYACKSCGKHVNKVENRRIGYAYKPYGQVSGYMCSDKVKYLKNNYMSMCLSDSGIAFESGKYLLDKNGRIMRGPFSKNNQQYNTFSNIKYWNTN